MLQHVKKCLKQLFRSLRGVLIHDHLIRLGKNNFLTRISCKISSCRQFQVSFSQYLMALHIRIKKSRTHRKKTGCDWRWLKVIVYISSQRFNILMLHIFIKKSIYRYFEIFFLKELVLNKIFWWRLLSHFYIKLKFFDQIWLKTRPLWIFGWIVTFAEILSLWICEL